VLTAKRPELIIMIMFNNVLRKLISMTIHKKLIQKLSSKCELALQLSVQLLWDTAVQTSLVSLYQYPIQLHICMTFVSLVILHAQVTTWKSLSSEAHVKLVNRIVYLNGWFTIYWTPGLEMCKPKAANAPNYDTRDQQKNNKLILHIRFFGVYQPRLTTC